jgi:hypothetical protein
VRGVWFTVHSSQFAVRSRPRPRRECDVRPPSAWRGAALARAQRPRDTLSGARKAKYGVKQAAPGNYRTRCSVTSYRDGILHSLNAPINPIARRDVRGSRLFKQICGLARAETNIARSSGTRQSGSPPRCRAIGHPINMPHLSRTRTTTISNCER